MPETAVIRLLLVDDHAMLRAGLVSLLTLEPDLEVVAQADTAAEALRLWQAERPDVGVIDLRMASLDGLVLLERIRKLDPEARLVVLTSSENIDDARAARRAGAAAYVTKHVEHERLLEAIRGAHAGGEWTQHGLLRKPGRALAAVTDREHDVLCMLRRGSTNAEIGQRLGITERTVKAHVKALCEKLGAADRAGAVARGFELGLLEIGGDR